MRIPRIYTDQALQAGSDATLDERVARHAGRVLRLRRGDELVLFNGDGHDYRARLSDVARTGASVQVVSSTPVHNESPLRLTLAQGIARGERMDYTLQKAVELGVSAIVPLFCRRTEVKLSGPRLEKRVAHWRGVIVSACEQCGRAVVPALEAPRTLRDWLADPPPGRRVVLRPEAETGASVLERDESVVLLIGPEGGLAEVEIDAARGAGFTPLKLGPRVLRTETAGPAALAALQALWGDLG